MLQDLHTCEGQNIYLLSKGPDHLWGLPGLIFVRCQGLFLGIKRPGCEADCSPSYLHCLMYLCGIYRDKFSLLACIELSYALYLTGGSKMEHYVGFLYVL